MHPEQLDRRFLLGGLAGAAGVSALAAMAKAGPLNPPPGPVAGSGRTTQELYDKIAAYGLKCTEINASNTPPSATAAAVISSPGCYALSADLWAAGATSGIDVRASPVVVDLNGFMVHGAFGPQVYSAQRATTVRNGQVRCNAGATEGVFLSQGGAVEDVHVDCTSADVATGLRVVRALVTGCAVTGGTNVCKGIVADESIVQRCRIHGVPAGLVGTDSVIEDCLITQWIDVGMVLTRCRVSRNAFYHSGSVAVGVNLVSRNVFRDNMISIAASAFGTAALLASNIGNIIEDNLVQGGGVGVKVSNAYNIIRRNIVGGSLPKFSVAEGNGLSPTIAADSSAAFTGGAGHVGPLGGADPNANLVF